MSGKQIVQVASLASLVLLGAPALAAPCPRTVEVDGEGDSASAVVSHLRTQGIPPAVPGCTPARARVTRAPGGFDVTLVEPTGRVTARHLASLEQVSTWVESMIRDDFLTPLLPTPAEPPGKAAPPPPQAVVVAVAPRGDSVPRVAINVGPAFGIGFDGTYMGGVGINGCFRLGPMCLGALGRLWGKFNDPPNGLTELVDRTVVHVLVTGELWKWQQFAPYLGVGLAWTRQVRTDRTDSDADDRGSIRAEIGLTATMALTRNFAAEGRLFVGVQPLASMHDRHIEGVRFPGDPIGDAGVGVSLKWRP